MTHIFKGIRSIFYDQKTLEKRGWDLSPREQRTYEYWALNLIAALIASGLCLSCIGVIWLFQTDQSHNETVYGIVKTVTNISIGILVTGILLALAKKN
jgi:hypothetical protein